MLENTGGWSKEKPLTKAKWYEVLVVVIIIISFSQSPLLLLLLLMLLLLTAMEFSLCGSSPYTSTNKTNKDKYT